MLAMGEGVEGINPIHQTLKEHKAREHTMETIVNSGNERLTIRPYDAGQDEARVIALWEKVFGKKIGLALWRWKYIDNPYETAILLSVNETGEPVVFYGGIPYAANFKGRRIVMIHLSDIMSHPDYRGSGLFIHTANAYFDRFGSRPDTHVMYGFPGKYHFDIGCKYLQYRAMGEVVYLKGKLEQMTSFEGRRSEDDGVLPWKWIRFFRDLGRDACHARLFKRARSIVKFTDSVFRIKGPDARFDDLWNRHASLYPFAVMRDGAFMRWRFFDHPLHRYEVWGIRDGWLRRSWQGAVVLRFLEDEKKAVIVDMVLPDSQRDVSRFMGGLAAMLLERCIETVETWLPATHFLVAHLEYAGLERKEEPTGIIPTIRIFDESMAYDWACENGYYTMADGDLF